MWLRTFSVAPRWVSASGRTGPQPACIVSGTETYLVDPVSSTDAMIGQVDRALLQLDRYQRGDLVVIVAGSPPNTSGTTNLIHVHRIGDLGFTGSDSRPGELPSTVSSGDSNATPRAG